MRDACGYCGAVLDGHRLTSEALGEAFCSYACYDVAWALQGMERPGTEAETPASHAFGIEDLVGALAGTELPPDLVERKRRRLRPADVEE